MTISHELRYNKTILRQYFENASRNNKKKRKSFISLKTSVDYIIFPANFSRFRQ